MLDDIGKARNLGASDAEILNSIMNTDPSRAGEIKAARSAGAPDTEILTSIVNVTAEKKVAEIKNEGWGSYLGSLAKGVVYGAGADAKGIGATLSAPVDTAQGGTMDKAGDAVQAAGALAQNLVPGYRPAAFDAYNPLQTASEIPKALAEATPGILAAVGTGALGGAVAGPMGAVVGGVGGAAAYGLARYWGQNATARAETQGRAQPTQADFNATLPESIAQAGIDGVTMKAGGIIGKGIGKAVGSKAGGAIADAGVEIAEQSGGRAAVAASQGLIDSASKVGAKVVGPASEAAAIGLGGAANNVLGQVARNDGFKDFDFKEVLDAGATGVGVRGAVGAVRSPGAVAGAIKYKAGGDINSAALTRVVDHMNSDAFPGDLTKRGETSLNIKMARETFAEPLAAFSKSPDDIKLSPSGKIALDEARRFLKSGAVFDEKQLTRLQGKIDNVVAFDAVADANATNWMARKSGEGEGQSLIQRIVGSGLRNPGKAGVLGAAMTEGLPLLMGGANLATGGKLAGVGLAAKALSKATGIDGVVNDPLGQIGERYGSPKSREALSGASTVEGMQRAQGLVDQLNAAKATEALPGVAPRGGGVVPHTPVPVFPAADPAPMTPQPSLAAALGMADTPQMPRARNETRSANDTGPLPMQDIPTILQEMRVQAQAEGQSILDVAHQQHRSARSIADNPNLPQGVREGARAQSKAIWDEIVKPMEAQASPEMVARARRPAEIDAGPAPESMLSPEGQQRMYEGAKAVADAVKAAPTDAVAKKAVDQFVSTFKGSDRKAAAEAVAKIPAVRRATKLTVLKRSAKGATAMKAARAKKKP